jgi:hypothetical protein
MPGTRRPIGNPRRPARRDRRRLHRLLCRSQGYNYARYLGFYTATGSTHLVTNPPNLPNLDEAMTTTLDGVTYKDRVLNETRAITADWLETREPQND